MKKMLVLALALVFILSGAVMADNYTGYMNHPFALDPNYEASFNDNGYVDAEEDGVVYFSETMGATDNPSADYYNLDYLNRNFTGDIAGKDTQTVKIKLPVQAYIPCYLEIKLTGNGGTTSVATFGAADGVGNTTNNGWMYQLTFDNEMGGFVDDNWDSLGYGDNVEFDLTDTSQDVYIRGCDIFAVEVASNAQYRYDVETRTLESDIDPSKTLNMVMRTDYNAQGSWQEVVISSDSYSDVYTKNPLTAGTTSTFIHDFKVPYDVMTLQGRYAGEIRFKAATI